MSSHTTYSNFSGGIATYEKEGAANQYAFGRSINHRSNSKEVILLPKTIKESGTIVADLVKWGETVGSITYLYGDAGKIYSRSSAGSYSLMRTVSNSHGNGLAYLGEDDFLYYTSDKALGRYGPISNSPTFTDDFLTSEGGVPLNTHSLDLESGSSQHATASDSATLSVTGNLCLECYVKPESLPTAGNSMTIIGKWDETTANDDRSYRLDIYAVSGYFGDGSDGALTISSNTTDAPIDSACTGTSGNYTLSATNASFASGQIVLIHQTQGTGAGTWQRNKISSYTAGTITLENSLNATYGTGAQVLVLKQYTNVTIDSGKTLTAKSWTGTVGGILAFIASGTTTITGSINANGNAGHNTNGTGGSGVGFKGGNGGINSNTAHQGDGSAGVGSTSSGANGSGGGGGDAGASPSGAGGAGGGHASSGSGGTYSGSGATPGSGGGSCGTSDLTTMLFGGGGGGGGSDSSSVAGGGSGAGIVFLSSTTLTVSGSISAVGGDGGSFGGASGGGGAGGSILLKAQTATLGSSIITATGGAGGGTSGGAGSSGRIHLDYYTSYTGTTSPTVEATQDNNLVTTTTYQLRLLLSSNGANSESYVRSLTNLAVARWSHLAVSWTASTSTAIMYEDGVSIGSAVGAYTAIDNNASLCYIGAYENTAGSATNFYDGKIDDIRIWSTTRTAAQILANKDVEISTSSANLSAYWQLDNSASDSTANGNNLTLVNSPTYTTDVPFSSPTTRLDIDQTDASTGNTYALGTSIDEGTSHRQSFIPTKDPQKSIQVNISAKGSSADWTITVHDPLNRVVASKTVTNANLNNGNFEFVFDTVWRPVRGMTYHFHLTATNTTGTPAVVSGTASNLETGQYTSYYQFLVEDTQFHTITQMLNFIAIANERYVATYDPSTGTYNPHRLVLPSGWKVRCFGKWRSYLMIGCWKGTNVYDSDKGIVFLWDGISTTYNDYFEVPEGAVNALLGSRGKLYLWAGYQGDMLEYVGGDYAQKVENTPKIDIDSYIEVLPGAVTMWQALLRFGVGTSDSTTMERGVYTFGSVNKNYPDSLSYDFPISTGNRTATNIQIGMVLPVSKKLLISWKDNVSYGVDVVDPAGSPYANGTIEMLITDDGGMWKEKDLKTLKASFKPLVSGESMVVKYRTDRESSWTTQTIDTVGATENRLPITEDRYNELQVAVDLETSVSTSPTLLELAVEKDLLATEQGF